MLASQCNFRFSLSPMSSALVWFRRDLRDFDHAALYHALKNYKRVFCAFVFDTEILDRLPDRADRRVEFIHGSLVELDAALVLPQGPAAALLAGITDQPIRRLSESG